MHGNKQYPDAGINENIAKAFEHAVAVVIGKCELRRSGDADEARHSTLARAVRPSFGVCRGEKEIGRALDERFVVGRKLRARKLLFEAIRDPATLEPVLKTAVPIVIHDAISHGPCSPASRPAFYHGESDCGQPFWLSSRVEKVLEDTKSPSLLATAAMWR